MIEGLISALCCFAVFIAGQIVLFHLADVPRRLRAMTTIWFILLALYAGLYLLLREALPPGLVSLDGITGFFNGILVYLLLFLSYCCFYFTDHSLCIAFMLWLEDRPEKRATLEELKQRFPYDALLKQRFGDLEANRFVIREGEYLRLTSKGKLYARFFGALKRFLRLEPGG